MRMDALREPWRPQSVRAAKAKQERHAAGEKYAYSQTNTAFNNTMNSIFAMILAVAASIFFLAGMGEAHSTALRCPHNRETRNCRFIVRGYDITGVLTQHQTNDHDPCACMLSCIRNLETCRTWVWKFDGRDGQRHCYLYSDTLLPRGVKLSINEGASNNIDVVVDNPAQGDYIPRCTFERDGRTFFDKFCFSGFVFAYNDPRHGYFC